MFEILLDIKVFYIYILVCHKRTGSLYIYIYQQNKTHWICSPEIMGR